MTAKVQIHVDEVADALVVPIESVFNAMASIIAWVQNATNLNNVVMDGATKWSRGSYQDGLKAGDKVVKSLILIDEQILGVGVSQSSCR